MTEHEQLMYRILGKISESNAPIVFKGALITKLILAENGFTRLDRKTIDIDANWIGTPPPMTELEAIVNRSLAALDGRFHAEAFREYGDKMSAGFYFIESATGDKIVTMDVDIRPICGSKTYHYGEIGIRGVLPHEILADKITVLSGQRLFRRAKDLVDVYALTHCVRVQAAEIFSIIVQKHLELGGFEAFSTRRSDVEHAYEMLVGVDGKPPFDVVYSYLTAFVRPFAQKDETFRVWNADNLAWENQNA